MKSKCIDVGTRKAPADLVVKGGKLVDVEAAKIIEDVDVAVKGGRIALVGDSEHCVDSRTKVVDARGKYIVPGLLDAHVHIESSMLTPVQFARAVLPHGTTGAFIDPHEIANVLGLRGVRLMLHASGGLPLKVFVTVPSCVPSAPRLETSGADLDYRDVKKALGWKRVVGLGEVMNFRGVIAGDRELHLKIKTALKRGLVVEGHAPGLRGEDLKAYIAAGIGSDHESSTPEEAIEKLRLGMSLQLREGSAAKNLAALIEPILREGLDTRRCMLATDDRHPQDLLREGHIDHVIRRAVEEGADPVVAVQMATLNTAEHFRVDRELGSISPGKSADILVIDDLKRFKVEMVIAGGRIVAEAGKLLVKLPKHVYPTWAKRTVKVKALRPEDFEIKAPVEKGRVRIRVIGVREGQLTTKHRVIAQRAERGFIMPDPRRDIAQVSVIERHHGTGNLSHGFVQGFGLREGAMASTVGHDAHNLIVVGIGTEDMAAAANAVVHANGGQAVVRQGKVLASVELPIAGLMSDEPAEVVSAKVEKLELAAQGMEAKLKAPFMALSFLPLAVIPELRITDKGLVDAKKFKLVGLFVKI